MARRRARAGRGPWAGALVASVALAAAGLTGCGSDDDARPSVPSVDFEPRLVVVVDDGEISAEAGPRPGAEMPHGPDRAADWLVPDGSVVELRVDGEEPARVVAEREPAGGGEASPLLDTGALEPGDVVTIALTEPGPVTFRFLDDEPDRARLVVVVDSG